MPEVYEIKDPRDGSVFEVQMDHDPTPQEAKTAVAKYRVMSAKASGQPTMGAEPDTGVFGAARQMYRKAFPPQPQRIDSNLATVAGMNIAPEDVLMVGQAGRAVAGAAKAGGGVIGAAKEAATQAAPAIKYEAVRTMLHSAGVPDAIATPLAMIVAGYQGKAKAEVPTTSPVESVPGGTAPPARPPVSSETGMAPKAYPDQKALNEQAIARRRAEYQQRQQAGGNAEAEVYARLRSQGKTDAEATAAVEQAKQLQAQLGVKTPTEAETKFPKGMRGKATPSGEANPPAREYATSETPASSAQREADRYAVYADKAEIPRRSEDWGNLSGQKRGTNNKTQVDVTLQGTKSYADYEHARGVTPEAWSEIKLLADEDKRVAIGALQQGRSLDEAMRIAYGDKTAMAAQPRKTAGTKNAKIADSAEGADSLEKLQDAIHGPDAPSQGNGTYKEAPTVPTPSQARRARAQGTASSGSAAQPQSSQESVAWYKTLPDAERESVFAKMRKIDEEAQSYRNAGNRLSPKYGEIAVGGAHFDELMKAEGRESFLRHLRNGKTPWEAAQAAKEDAKAMVQKFNTGREYQTRRYEGTADSWLDDLARRFNTPGRKP